MEDLNKAKEDISIQVASAYLQVLFNEELVKVANEQLALSKEMLEQKTAFYKNGKASQAEWYEAKARVAQDELSAVQAENNRRLSLLDLSQLLELPSPDDFAIVSPATDSIAGLKIQTSPAEVYAEAVLTKPSVKAAQYRLEGAEKSIRMAKGAYYPQLSFGAGISTISIMYRAWRTVISVHSCATTSASISVSRSAFLSSTVLKPVTAYAAPVSSNIHTTGNWRKVKRTSTKKYSRRTTMP